jgi:NAD+ kinase
MPGERGARAVVRVVPRAVLDDEGVPWDADVDVSDLPAPPTGLSYDEATPGATLPELATRLLNAVRAQYKDTMYDECVVDMSPFGVEECSGDLHDACAEVAVAANAAQVAGDFNMAMRRRELRRLRAALWELRKMLEAAPEGCSITVRHRLELLRSASLDVCHPRMRAADAPPPSAIPNFQTVHLDVAVDAVPDIFSDPSDRSDVACDAETGGAAVAFFRGGQPTAEGRSWMVSRGFKTVVDLRFEDRDNQWTRPVGGGAGVGKLGDESLEVIHIPVTDMEPPSFEDVERFIEVADDESKRPMFVHCKAGIGRTGSMVSCWRISRGMKVDDALALESLNCDFGSLAQEAFVREFADRLARKRLGSWDDDDEERATLRKLEQEAHAAEEAAEATKPAGTAKAHEPSSAVYKVAWRHRTRVHARRQVHDGARPVPFLDGRRQEGGRARSGDRARVRGRGVQRGRRVGVCFERAVPVDAERAGGHGQRRFHRGGVRGGRALVSRPGAGHVRDPHGRFHVHARGGGGAHAQDLAPLHAAAGARVARPPEAHLHRQEARVGAPAQPHRGGARVHVHGVRGDRGGVRYGRDASRGAREPRGAEGSWFVRGRDGEIGD